MDASCCRVVVLTLMLVIAMCGLLVAGSERAKRDVEGSWDLLR